MLFIPGKPIDPISAVVPVEPDNIVVKILGDCGGGNNIDNKLGDCG